MRSCAKPKYRKPTLQVVRSQGRHTLKFADFIISRCYFAFTLIDCDRNFCDFETISNFLPLHNSEWYWRWISETKFHPVHRIFGGKTLHTVWKGEKKCLSCPVFNRKLTYASTLPTYRLGSPCKDDLPFPERQLRYSHCIESHCFPLHAALHLPHVINIQRWILILPSVDSEWYE